MGTQSKTINQRIMCDTRFNPDQSFSDGDGYWIALRRGYRCAFSDCHTIHEWTVKDVLSAIAAVEQCDCDQCIGERK